MQSQLSRRSLLKLTGLAGLGAAAAGCSSGPPDGTATWSMWSSSPAERKVWDAFGAYVERELGVRSAAMLTPSGGYPTKLDLQLVSGTAGLVTAINGTLIPTYAARGAHQPLDDLIAADPDFDLTDFYQPIRKISSFNGKTYAIGFDVAPTVLYYNKTLLAKQGIPEPSPTEPMPWATFRELAKELTRPPDQYGFTCAPAIDDLVSWIYCAGGNVMNDDATRSILAEPEALEAVQFVVDLFVKDKVTPPIANLVTENSLANFLEGNVAFMQNGPWQVVNVRKAKFDWDVVPFPAGAVGSTPRVSGSGFAIPSGVRGKDLELAWKLLKTLTSTGALDIYAKAGRNNPARLSAGSAFKPPPDNLGIVQQILAGKLAGGHPFDVTSNWNQVKQLLGQDLPRTFLGQVPVRDAIDGLTPRLDVLMQQHQDNVRQATARKG
ncbi:multiple sugar transport system substrate-binding protein [Kribbella amoyensis]|uniref:Multiple sugar transport system substrate-binding protein n=1 Tax=Kribbella amoyensis TaxID=996641 RepID=A0A561BZW7_9ACTN|nr:sugar ABC transporter substrate-binding protein [Kribbella amoyensis]TWD84222.1 multiple sugar transport system substrate-binding protein [Kribbella amoyensis]